MSSSLKDVDLEEPSLEEEYVARLDKFMADNKFISCIFMYHYTYDEDEDKYDEDSSDEEEKPQSKPATAEQIAKTRLLMMTKTRREILTEVRKYILGEEYGKKINILDQSFSNDVINTWESLLKPKLNSATPAKKFDWLLAFTFCIKKYGVWMRNHEDGVRGKKMLSELGRRWKNILAKTDKAIGIDSEYTRPGVIYLLEQLKSKTNAYGKDNYLTFKY